MLWVMECPALTMHRLHDRFVEHWRVQRNQAHSITKGRTAQTWEFRRSLGHVRRDARHRPAQNHFIWTTCSASLPVPFASISRERGFLPTPDPLLRVTHPDFQEWEETVRMLPSLHLAGSAALRHQIARLPPISVYHVAGSELDPEASSSSANLSEATTASRSMWRVYQVISFLAHAYIWCGDSSPPPALLPKVVAVPWVAAAKALSMPPVLVYSTYNLLNWRRLDPHGPVALGNIICNNNFLGGVDEEWFRLVHITIEAQAGAALVQLKPLQRAAQQDDVEGVRQGLVAISHALQQMQATLVRMNEKCDPYIYYKRVRQPMAGWRGNPDLPAGLVYEGVSEQPFQLYGETGAQSSVVPAFDAALGIEHQDNWLRAYLQDMRAHMPPEHRLFLSGLEAGPSVRSYVQNVQQGARAGLKGDYNEAVAQLQAFRNQHRSFAAAYIAQQARKQEVGTGGSDFMPALTEYRNTTSSHLLPN